MPLSLITVGKIAKPFAEAAREYEKRLSRYDKVEVIELPDEKEPAHLSPAAIAQVMDKEGRSILGRIVSKPSEASQSTQRVKRSHETVPELVGVSPGWATSWNAIVGTRP